MCVVDVRCVGRCVWRLVPPGDEEGMSRECMSFEVAAVCGSLFWLKWRMGADETYRPFATCIYIPSTQWLGRQAAWTAKSARSQTHHITRSFQQCLGLGAKQLTEGGRAKRHETLSQILLPLGSQCSQPLPCGPCLPAVGLSPTRPCLHSEAVKVSKFSRRDSLCRTSRPTWRRRSQAFPLAVSNDISRCFADFLPLESLLPLRL